MMMIRMMIIVMMMIDENSLIEYTFHNQIGHSPCMDDKRRIVSNNSHNIAHIGG